MRAAFLFNNPMKCNLITAKLYYVTKNSQKRKMHLLWRTNVAIIRTVNGILARILGSVKR